MRLTIIIVCPVRFFLLLLRMSKSRETIKIKMDEFRFTTNTHLNNQKKKKKRRYIIAQISYLGFSFIPNTLAKID